MAKPARSKDTVIDACCLVNFCAVDASLSFLGEFGLSWRLALAAQKEGVYIRVSPGSHETIRIDVNPAVQAGLVETCLPTDGAETDLYVLLAQDLDDGEAMSLAIAKSRGWMLATDDRKARRKAEELGVRTLTTPELMRRWAERNKRPTRVVADALRRIEALARFTPARTAPEFAWWRNQMKKSPANDSL